MVDAHLNGKEINTKDITRLIIGGQTGVDGIRFCVASTVNGEDLTDPALGWFLQFKNKYGLGEPITLSPVYEDSLIKLPWVPGSTATQVAGRLQIQVFAAKTEVVGEVTQLVKQWVSLPAVIYIEENLNPDPITPIEPTVLNQYLVMFTSLKEAAEAAALAAAGSLVDFEKRYLGGKDSDPVLDNQGEALLSGALYYNTVTEIMRLYNGVAWIVALGTAEQLGYNNEDSGLESEDVKAALDELDGNVSKVALGVVKNDLDIQDLQRNLLLENQSEAKASVSDYGIVTLPKNATGNLKMKREGLTAENLNVNGNAPTSVVSDATGTPICQYPDGLWVFNGSNLYNPSFQLYQGSIGDKIYVSVKCKPTSVGRIGDRITLIFSDNSSQNNSKSASFLATASVLTLVSYLPFMVSLDESTAGVVNRDFQMVINLTSIFGSGTEPTEAQCHNIFSSYFADTKNVPFTGRYRGRGKNLIDGTWSLGYLTPTGDFASLANNVTSGFMDIKSSAYVASGNTTFTFITICYYDINKVFISPRTKVPGTSLTATAPSNARYARVHYELSAGISLSTINNFNLQFELGSTATTYTPFEAHDLYLTAPEGKSVPSAKDSVEVVDGRLVHVQRVEAGALSAEKVTNGSFATDTNWGTHTGWTIDGKANFLDTSLGYIEQAIVFTAGKLYKISFDLSDATDARLNIATQGGTSFGSGIFSTYQTMVTNGAKVFYATATTSITSIRIYAQTTGSSFSLDNLSIKEIDTTAGATNTTPSVSDDGITAQYQLVTPITTPIDNDGAIPAGASVYWEPAIPDVGIYGTQFDILDTDHPIASIDKLYKVAFATGVQTQLTDAVIAGDGLSFTSASLADGDLINVLYYYATANPEGLTTAEYLNSNVVFADTANGKYYKLNPVVTNGELVSWQPVEVV